MYLYLLYTHPTPYRLATGFTTSLMTGSTLFSVALGVATSGSAALY